MRIGLNVAMGASEPPSHAGIVEEVQGAARAGLASAWWPQLPPIDGLTPWDALTSIAATGTVVPGIELGTSVVVSWPRHPLALAVQALTTQAIVEGRLTVGVGLSHAPFVETVYGIKFERPAEHLREYLTILNSALRGEVVDVQGTRLSAAGAVRLPGATAPEVVLAALSPHTLRLAGELAEGVMTTWAGPRALRERLVPPVAAAASAAGKPAPRVIAGAIVSVTSDPSAFRAFVSERFAMAAGVPAYRAALDYEGASTPGDAAITGDEDEVARAIAQFADAGATDLVASVFGSSDDQARTLALLGTLTRPQLAVGL